MFISRTLAALAVLSWAGCDSLECGKNTVKQGGECIAEVTDPGADCGPGTVWNPDSGRCENSIFEGGGVCGANTIVVVNDAGVHTCVGTGSGSGDCSQPLPCPSPSADNISLCGRIFDLEDSTPLDDGDAGDGEPYRGVELRVYDPIPFISNPTLPPILRAAPDSCGRFAIGDVTRPTDGFIAVATADLATSGQSTYVLTGIAAPTLPGQTLDGLRVWVFRKATDTTWSTAAGLSGTTFGTTGSYIAIFLSGNGAGPFPQGPTMGATIADFVNGSRGTHPDSDYYFDDTNALQRKTLSPTRTSSGANGTGIFIGAPFGTYSGIGGAPTGTCWAKDLAAAPAGAAYVQERTAAGANCP